MRYYLIFSAFFIFLSGCSTTTYTRNISKGVIQDPKIRISAKDKSFELQGEFQAPFHSATRYNSLQMSDKELIKGYKNALHHGARHVIIEINDKTLYGVLALDKADKDGIGPGTQSYKIIIPQAYIDAAKNGKISVVYEYYKLKNDGIIDVGDIKERSWILWLSDEDIFE